MDYKYITDDNFTNKQNYMYSEFGGADFLRSYLASRAGFVEKWENDNREFHDTRRELTELAGSIDEKPFLEYKECINNYVKRFEVSKLLYTEYNGEWKKTENATYDKYDLYFLLCECCIKGYRATGCTKYLNCALKINDTMISRSGDMTESEKKKLCALLDDEMYSVKELSEELEVEEWF